MTEMHRKEYYQAVELAESGHYEQALQQMQSYLKDHPNDGEALNDTGTILFCMHLIQSLSLDLCQIIHNIKLLSYPLKLSKTFVTFVAISFTSLLASCSTLTLVISE